MAKLERTVNGDFDCILRRIEEGIQDDSVSAAMEDWSDFQDGYSRCAVRIFERCSCLGGNRVSLSVTLFQGETGPIYLSAITAGGSQALLFKLSTFGEEAFLDRLRELL